MGENKKHIHVVGAFGIENILKTTKELYDRIYFEKYFAFRFNKINFVLVFHSLTLDSNNNLKVFNNIIKALLKIKNSNIFISSPGYDVGSNEIIKFISLSTCNKFSALPELMSSITDIFAPDFRSNSTR